MVLSPGQLADYRRDGFVVLRGHLPEADIERMEAGFARNPPLDGTLDPAAPVYPGPGRYTLALNAAKDPDLAFLAGHPSVTGAAGDALGDEPRLSAFVIYDRTPGGPGIPSHNDYKRWRPVGSSMNWVFTIVPFGDFDEAAGRLFVAPGSHHPERVTDGPDGVQRVAPPNRPDESEYVDPELRRGDLLVMDMHLWHRADGNRSDRHRVGAFNKYAAASAPPATGWFVFDDDVHDALAPEHRSLLAVHSSRPLTTTRVLLVREREEAEVLVTGGSDGEPIRLPGGRATVERAIPDWDHGNVIAAAEAALREHHRIEVPWLTWVGDHVEGDGMCRVYAHPVNDLGFGVPYDGARWLTRTQLEAEADRAAAATVLAHLDRWLDPTVVRGKGLTQAQSRIDQYAY